VRQTGATLQDAVQIVEALGRDLSHTCEHVAPMVGSESWLCCLGANCCLL
jgi:hypothetical protein